MQRFTHAIFGLALFALSIFVYLKFADFKDKGMVKHVTAMGQLVADARWEKGKNVLVVEVRKGLSNTDVLNNRICDIVRKNKESPATIVLVKKLEAMDTVIATTLCD